MTLDFFDIAIGAAIGALLAAPAQHAVGKLLVPVKRRADAARERLQALHVRYHRFAVTRAVIRKPDLIGKPRMGSFFYRSDFNAEWQVDGKNWVRCAIHPENQKRFGVTPLHRHRGSMSMSMNHSQTRYFATARQAAARINQALSAGRIEAADGLIRVI